LKASAFSADGKTLVSGSADEALKSWDVDTLQELLSFKIAPEVARGVMLSPDKSALAIRTGQGVGRHGDVLLLRAPTFAEIEAREKTNAAARAVVKLED
jgi:hypothetical protein